MTELPRQLSDGAPEGNIFGRSPADNISFYGATPTQQPGGGGTLAPIVDNSGGVANAATGVVAVPAAYSQAELANALATIIAQHNALVQALAALGLINPT